jgi:CDGSH-type Zn-finger protein
VPDDNPKKRAPGIRVTRGGPYVVTGGPPLGVEVIVSNQFGIGLKWEKGRDFPLKETYSLCRCGHTATPPYCDGTHTRVAWESEETALKTDYLTQAETIEGPGLRLTDARVLCAGARFCERSGGAWNLTKRSEIPKFRDAAVKECHECPSGRLVAWDKESGQALEPELEKSISVTEDPFTESSGPLWVKGGIPVESANGGVYEVRHRVTLCRCGHSKNKPFCDGRHATEKYRAGEESRPGGAESPEKG